MREIKFRGRKINTTKWVVGNLGYFKDNGHAGILVDGKLHIVDIETVGQYTGLKDMDGVDIYEGDLVEHDDNIDGYWETYEASEIEYDDAYAMFCFKSDASNFLCDYRNLKVVGNKYENK